MIWIIGIIIAVVLVVIAVKSYHINWNRSIIAFTGGVGAGKTNGGVKGITKDYKAALKRWKKDCFRARFFRKELPEKPLLFSTVPIITKKYRSCELTPEIVLLQVKIPQGSCILADEVSTFLNQFEFSKNENVRLFDEFCRFFRQYIRGRMIITDQCSQNVVLQIRRRLNTIYNLCDHHYWLGINMVKVREIHISDEIINVEQEDTNKTFERLVYFGNIFKLYDSFCFSDRYQLLPPVQPVEHQSMKSMRLFVCPNKIFENKIENTLKTADKPTVPTGSAMPEVCGTVDDIGDLFDV